MRVVVDRIYVINLKECRHRRSYMEYIVEKYSLGALSKEGRVYFLEGFRPLESPLEFAYGKGAYGATISHLLCMQDALDHNFETIMILEDDCILHRNFWSLWNSTHVPAEWEMVHLGAIQMNWNHIDFYHQYYRSKDTLSAHAYLLRCSIIQTLFNLFSSTNLPIDEVFVKFQQISPVSSYTLYPNVMINHIDESYVREKNDWSVQRWHDIFRWNLYSYDWDKTPLSFK